MRGLLDTSVVIVRQVTELPDEAAISAATLAELHFGLLLAGSDAARRLRLRRLTEVEARFDPLPIDASVARSYGMLAHVTVLAGRRPRRRALDLLIAATAHANDLPLYTRDRGDLAALDGHIDVLLV
ncbi:MAG: PIN domain-containing protein [Nitriliruptor sp.]